MLARASLKWTSGPDMVLELSPEDPRTGGEGGAEAGVWERHWVLSTPHFQPCLCMVSLDNENFYYESPA